MKCCQSKCMCVIMRSQTHLTKAGTEPGHRKASGQLLCIVGRGGDEHAGCRNNFAEETDDIIEQHMHLR